MKTSTYLTISLFALALALFSNISFAAKPVYVGGKERAAIRGYDPVAYFIVNRPVKGSEEFTIEYRGATWMFANAENLERFRADPDRYQPQYGGYCAYAVANGTTASIKPQYFTIYEDKLYLNYSKSVYKKWIKKKGRYIREADKNWPELQR